MLAIKYDQEDEIQPSLSLDKSNKSQPDADYRKLKYWYYKKKNREIEGPINEGLLPSLIEDKKVNQSTLFWSDKLDSWIEFCEIDRLMAIVQHKNSARPGQKNAKPEEQARHPIETLHPENSKSYHDFNDVPNKPTNHLLHFTIGIFTIGLWWFVWIFLVFIRS